MSYSSTEDVEELEERILIAKVSASRFAFFFSMISLSKVYTQEVEAVCERRIK